MTSAQKILTMIETVSPNDMAKLNEIDLAVDVFLFPKEWGKSVTGRYCSPSRAGEYPQYTRSRDALKAIRPEGYSFNVFFCYRGDKKYFLSSTGHMEKNPHVNPIHTPDLATEELAELHAIIQAIECERKKS